MANSTKVETRKLAVTTADQAVDFGHPMIGKVYLIADAATVRVDFDQPTDDGSFPFLTANVAFELNLPFHKLHASTSTGTANLYMIAVR